MIQFSTDDKQKISAAIQAAERRTSGEFVAVVARRADPYSSIALLWGAGLALLLPALLLFLPTGLRFLHIYQLQLLSFAVAVMLIMSWQALHLALVPKAVKHARASRLARAQFYEQGVQLTAGHSGVLFFVSLAEHYVEIVADKDIHEKVGAERWQEIVAAFVAQVGQGEVTEGFIAAIGAIGDAMAQHYPRAADDRNELSDGLIEI
jgi:putative membrane protein